MTLTPPAPGGRSGLATTLRFNALWALAGRGVGIVAAFALNAIAARLLSPGDFGAYLLAVTIAFAAAHVAELGVPEIATRLVAEADATGRSGRTAALIRRCGALVAVGSTLTGLALLTPPVRAALAALLPVAQLDIALPAIVIMVVVRTLATLTAEVFRGLGDVRLATLLDGTLGSALASVLCLLLLRAGTTSLRDVLLLTAVAGIAPALIGAALLAVRVRASESGQQAHDATLRELLVPAAPNLVNRVALYTLSQLDLWVVAVLLTTADAGLYGSALRSVLLVSTPLLVVHQIMPAVIAGHHALGRARELERLLRTAATVAGVPALAVLLVLVVAGGPILDLAFGAFYRAAAPVLAVLALGRALVALAGPCGTVLLMTGRQRVLMRVSLVTVGVTLPLMLLGGAAFGPVGVAAASSAGAVAQASWLWWLARRELGISTHMRLDLGWRGRARTVL